MKKMILSVFTLTFMLNVSAQISANTNPISLSHLEEISLNEQVNVLPNVDVVQLKLEDSKTDKAFDNRFAFGHQVNWSLENTGEWTDLANGDRIWRLKFKSEGALSLNTVFKHFELPIGASVHIFSPDYKHVIGGFTARNNKSNYYLATTPIPGEEVVIEYFEPQNVQGQGVLEIQTIGHDYKNIFNITVEKGFNTSGACNNNVVCPEGDAWVDQSNSVAMSMIGGTRWCSGAMVANTENDSVPYYLTANHCIDGQNPATWLFVFNYKSPNCNPNTNGSLSESVANSTLRANRASTDVALLELSSIPPFSYDVFYAGWDKSDVVPVNQTGIHHPDGDVMKISFDDQSASKQNWGGASCWEISDWDDGTTEPGSSGSPLFDENKRVIGQLFGGSASCNSQSEDYYGRFGISWDGTNSSQRLHDWLDPQGTDSDTQEGYYLNNVTGLDELSKNEIQFSIYPNPSNGLFQLETDVNIENIKVMDINGKIVYSTRLNSSLVNLNNLESGFYFLKLNGSSVMKIQVLN